MSGSGFNVKTRLVGDFILVFVLVLPVVGFGNQDLSLDEVKIREYRGEKLGFVCDFRENSIKGAQRVDPEKYRLVVDGLVKQPQSFSLEDLQSFPRKKKLVTLFCVEGWWVKSSLGRYSSFCYFVFSVIFRSRNVVWTMGAFLRGKSVFGLY